jgi:pimeloyl-ACP methyl ester carboxylesterase
MSGIVSVYKNPQAEARCMAVYDAALSAWPVPYTEVRVPTAYGETHVVVSGAEHSPPLILLHGQWSTATMWSPLIPGLAHTRRAYAVDQIDDVGKSRPTRIPSGRPEYAQWLVEVVDQLKIQQADLIGLSYGGFLGLNFALHAPDRVRSLVLLSPGLPSLGRPTPSWAIHGLPMTIFPVRATAKWLVGGMSVRGYQSSNREMEQLIASATSVRSRIPFRPAFTEDELHKLSLPVLLLVGEKEAMYEPRSAVNTARGLIPGIQAEVIPGAGHMLSTDQPEKVAARIQQFLSRPLAA